MATSSSRRAFLRTCVLLAAAAAPIGVAGEAMSLSGNANGLRRSSFSPHLKRRFALVAADGTVHHATLVEVADLAAGPRAHDRKFRLLFSMSSRPPGGIFELRHPRVATTELFVTPVGNGDRYEVVIDAN